MADLDPLIRYRKHGIDEKRRVLAALYRQAEELEKQKQLIKDQIEQEKELAKDMDTVESAAFLGLYIQGARKKITTLDKSIRQIELKITIAQEDMRNAFAEMKKIEITRRNRENREKAAKKRRDEQELNEIAIEQYRRRLEEGE